MEMEGLRVPNNVSIVSDKQ